MGSSRGFTEVRTGADLDFTAFYYVQNMGPIAEEFFNSDDVPEVRSLSTAARPLPTGVPETDGTELTRCDHKFRL